MTTTTPHPTIGPVPHLYRVPLTISPLRRIHQWNNMNPIHKAIMQLFPETLPGPTNERRTTSAILYRIETDPTPHILLQTLTPVLPEYRNEVEETDLMPVLTNLTQNTTVAFRTRINAVRRNETNNSREPITPEQLPGKLLHPTNTSGLLNGALTNITILDTHHSVLHNNRTPINTYRVTGLAQIDNPETLAHKIVHGIGPARSYGCGLLSIIPN